MRLPITLRPSALIRKMPKRITTGASPMVKKAMSTRRLPIAPRPSALTRNCPWRITTGEKATVRKAIFDKAIADYTEAIRLDPKFAQAYNNRGGTYYGKGEFDKAIADFSEAIRLNPKYAHAYYNRGLVYSKQGENRKADEEFARAKELGYTAVSADEAKASKQGKEIAVDLGHGVKLEMVLIPAGGFLMGSPDSDKRGTPDETPQHWVRINKPFYMGKYPVTQEQWQAVMGNNPSHLKRPKNPVEMVSWDDCQVFLGKLNAQTGGQGGKFALPTEAQWEYACRAGSTTQYCFGDDEAQLGKYAWYSANSGNITTHPVGEKKPNAWGLYDMHGNVWEYCRDWYDEDYYVLSPADDPAGPPEGSDRVHRGGMWSNSPVGCRSAYRTYGPPGWCDLRLGLRVAQVPADKSVPVDKSVPADKSVHLFFAGWTVPPGTRAHHHKDALRLPARRLVPEPAQGGPAILRAARRFTGQARRRIFGIVPAIRPFAIVATVAGDAGRHRRDRPPLPAIVRLRPARHRLVAHRGEETRSREGGSELSEQRVTSCTTTRNGFVRPWNTTRRGRCRRTTRSPAQRRSRGRRSERRPCVRAGGRGSPRRSNRD